MSGYVGDLSTQQAEVLEKFRENVKPKLKPKQYEDNHYLLRWLRARDFNLKKAETMLLDTLAWRKQNGVDTILEDYVEPEVIKKYRPGGMVGKDKTGSPVFVDPYGLVDMKGILRCCTKGDVMKKFVYEVEKLLVICEEESIKRGSYVEGCLIIYDLDKYGYKHLAKICVDAYLAIVEIAESHYPETLKRVFVINSPKIFPIVWSIVKPWLHEATVKKVSLLSGNYKEALLAEIDADQLPVCYGGTLTDPDGDPRCKTMINQGGMVPKEYYNQPVPDVSMTTATVGRGSTLQVDFEVHHPNSMLRYQFHSEDHDVGFGVFRRTSNERQKATDMETILSTQRTNSNLVAEEGFVDCKKAGTYVMRFDNTYSWTRNKKVYYVIEVLEPDSNSENSEQEKQYVADNNDSEDDDDEFVLADEEITPM